MKYIRSLISIVLVSTIIFSSQGFIFSASALDDESDDFSKKYYLGDVNLDDMVTAVDARIRIGK